MPDPKSIVPGFTTYDFASIPLTGKISSVRSTSKDFNGVKILDKSANVFPGSSCIITELPTE